MAALISLVNKNIGLGFGTVTGTSCLRYESAYESLQFLGLLVLNRVEASFRIVDLFHNPWQPQPRIPSIAPPRLYATFTSFNSGTSTRLVDLIYLIVSKVSGLWLLSFALHLMWISSIWQLCLLASPGFTYMPLTLGLQTIVGRRPSWHNFTSLGLYCLKDSDLSVWSVLNFICHFSQCIAARPTISGTSDLHHCISSCCLSPRAGSRIHSYINILKHRPFVELPIMSV
jgi:hypothetical protein